MLYICHYFSGKVDPECALSLSYIIIYIRFYYDIPILICEQYCNNLSISGFGFVIIVKLFYPHDNEPFPRATA